MSITRNGLRSRPITSCITFTIALLDDAGLRVELDDSSNTIGYKIRNAQTQKIPYMLIIGAKEIETGTVAVRNRAGETVTKTIDAFLSDALLEVAEKRR